MQSIPDINSIGSISRAFGYDRLNRKTSETMVGDRTDTWTYDPAGNVLGSSKLPPTTYDVLNRMMTRNIDGDTARFTYDAAGNMLSAVNRISRIFRSYHRNGALKTDTARTSTDHIAAGDFSQHIYGLRFSYDLSGRRTAMKLPGSLDSSSDSVSYSYDPVFGQLAEVKDLGGTRYKFAYDSVGRLSRRTLRSAQSDSLIETREYDSDSRLTRRILRAGSDSLQNEILRYVARGKVIKEQRWGDTTAYNGLGHLTYHYRFAGGLYETFMVDALGHRKTREASGALYIPVTTSHYQSGTGRLLKTVGSAMDVPDTSRHSYDGLGNQSEEQTVRMLYPLSGGSYAFDVRSTLSEYNSAQQLIRTNYYFDTIPAPGVLRLPAVQASGDLSV